ADCDASVLANFDIMALRPCRYAPIRITTDVVFQRWIHSAVGRIKRRRRVAPQNAAEFVLDLNKYFFQPVQRALRGCGKWLSPESIIILIQTVLFSHRRLLLEPVCFSGPPEIFRPRHEASR